MSCFSSWYHIAIHSGVWLLEFRKLKLHTNWNPKEHGYIYFFEFSNYVVFFWSFPTSFEIPSVFHIFLAMSFVLLCCLEVSWVPMSLVCTIPALQGKYLQFKVRRFIQIQTSHFNWGLWLWMFEDVWSSSFIMILHFKNAISKYVIVSALQVGWCPCFILTCTSMSANCKNQPIVSILPPATGCNLKVTFGRGSRTSSCPGAAIASTSGGWGCVFHEAEDVFLGCRCLSCLFPHDANVLGI